MPLRASTTRGLAVLLLSTALATPLWAQSRTEILLRTGDAAPGTAGARFDSFSGLRLADDGRPAFFAFLQSGVGDAIAGSTAGIWLGDTRVLRTGTDAPASLPGARIFTLGTPEVNGLGQVATVAQLEVGVGGVTGEDSLVILRDGQVVQRTGFGAPGTAGAVFDSFAVQIAISNPSVAYVGFLRPGVGDTTPDNSTGIWHGNRLGVRTGDPAAGSTGAARFAAFASPAINDWGLTAFGGGLREGVGGVGPESATGLWMYGDNGDAIELLRTGDSFDGRTVANLFHFPPEALNTFGQFGFLVRFTDDTEALAVYTPDLHWRGIGSGLWNDRSRWALGLPPGAPHDVTIAPAGDVTVAGLLGNSRIRSLTLGGGPGLATLRPDAGALQILEGFGIAENGRLTGSANLTGEIRNAGGITARALGLDGSIENLGTIRGATGPEDRLGGTILNTAGGLIDVRAGEGLTLEGPVATLGETRVIGGRLESHAGFANPGTVNARAATMDFAGGLENTGRVQLSLGITDVFGDVDNAAAGQIGQSGGGTVTFWDDMKNNGEIRVSEGGAAGRSGAAGWN